MTAIMRMHSLLTPTVSGGIGDSIVLGDGVHHGIIEVGMVRDIGLAATGADGSIITIICIRDIIIRTMHGAV